MEDAEIVDLFFQRSEQAIPETAAKYQGLIFRFPEISWKTPRTRRSVSTIHTWAYGTPSRPTGPIPCWPLSAGLPGMYP